MNERDRRVRRTAPPRVRLVDVAREAGLSKTTVSAALNGTGRLSAEVRAHARETARRMGYRPNATARLLRAGHARLIGFTAREYVEAPWSYLESPYLSELTHTTAQLALEHGYAMVLLPNCSPRDEWTDLPVDAVILADPEADDPLVDDFLAAGIPVFTDQRVEGRQGGYWVDIDYDAAMRSVLDHLAAQGAHDIVLIAPQNDSQWAQRSMDSYLAWCGERDIAPNAVATQRPGNAAVLKVADEVLSEGPPPDALFALAEVSPPLMIDVARKHGLSVPDDILLVCCSEDPVAAHCAPPVTTLSMQPSVIAAAGMELLLDALESGNVEPAGRVVPTRLDVRASSLRKTRG